MKLQIQLTESELYVSFGISRIKQGAESMDIKVSQNGSVTVISIIGQIDASNSKNLKNRFSEIQSTSNNYVMDFSSVDFIDSSGLGAFVACLKSAIEKGGNIKVANLQKKTRMVFEITRIHKICDIFDNLEVAVKSYSQAS